MSNRYHIRYNTKHGDSDLVWRIFENGVEHLVKNFHINVPAQSETTIENDVVKYNVSCSGTMTIIDNVAFIN